MIWQEKIISHRKNESRLTNPDQTSSSLPQTSYPNHPLAFHPEPDPPAVGQKQFMALFKLVLTACVSKGLISGKRQAIDSVFVKANAAMSRMVERQVFGDAAAYGKELEHNTDQEAQSQNVALMGGQQNGVTKPTQALRTPLPACPINQARLPNGIIWAGKRGYIQP